MLNMLSTATGNAYVEAAAYVINANRKGRYPYLLITAPFFVYAAGGLVYLIVSDIETNVADLSIVSYLGILMMGCLFGYMSISYLIQLVNIKELVLLPEQKKVQVRLERNKRVVSEHALENVSLTKQRVEHEEPYRASMKWFTVYDTSTGEQLFCIRPGNRDTDGMAVEELTELFNAVMYPAEYAKRRERKQKEIEERNKALREERGKAADDQSKWDSLA